jgi:hypothetical protein
LKEIVMGDIDIKNAAHRSLCCWRLSVNMKSSIEKQSRVPP